MFFILCPEIFKATDRGTSARSIFLTVERLKSCRSISLSTLSHRHETRRKLSRQGVMGPFFVVTLQPFLTDLSNLVQRLNHIGVEHIRPIGPVIALDKSILIRLARLDVRQLNRPIHTPGDEPFGNEFRALVEPNRLGLPSPAHHLLKHSDHALHRERHIHFDGQPLPHAFIQYIRHPEPSVAVQRIAIKSPTQTAFGCGITAGVEHNISKSPALLAATRIVNAATTGASRQAQSTKDR